MFVVAASDRMFVVPAADKMFVVEVELTRRIDCFDEGFVSAVAGWLVC